MGRDERAVALPVKICFAADAELTTRMVIDPIWTRMTLPYLLDHSKNCLSACFRNREGRLPTMGQEGGPGNWLRGELRRKRAQQSAKQPASSCRTSRDVARLDQEDSWT